MLQTTKRTFNSFEQPNNTKTKKKQNINTPCGFLVESSINWIYIKYNRKQKNKKTAMTIIKQQLSPISDF
jgi:hypothetical protein